MSVIRIEKTIAQLCPSLSRGQIRKAAKRMQYLHQSPATAHDWYVALRANGVIDDPTARIAIRNLESAGTAPAAPAAA